MNVAQEHTTEHITRVMITGATTPIGRALIAQLLEDEKIRCILALGFETTQKAYAANPDWAESALRLTYQQCDLTRSRHVWKLMFGIAKELKIQAVIHMAQHRAAKDTGRKVHALNVESTKTLMDFSERHPTIKRFIYRSYGDVYKISAALPVLISEDHTLNLEPQAPQWIRDRVEADLTVCTRMGLSPLHIVVLRCAECLCPNQGSQLQDYLSSAVCFRPLGYDPMLNILTLSDMARAMKLALKTEKQGVFNIPGKDTLPLSRVIQLAKRQEISVPGVMLYPLYIARSLTTGTDFRYDMNRYRFHFSCILNGQRARQDLQYTPQQAVQW